MSPRVVAALFLATFSVTPALCAPLQGVALDARDLSLFARENLRRGGVQDGGQVYKPGN